MWRRDRKVNELYYLAPDGRLMAVVIDAQGRAAVPRSLFRTRSTNLGSAYQSYAAATDGQRFLILTPVNERSDATVVFNWTSTVKGSAR